MADDDATLVGAWRDGDRAAGERLVDRYFKAVTRFFRNKVGDRAPDLVQKTFLACVEALPRFRGDGSFRSFLFAIAYKQLCRHYERGRRRRERFDVLVHTAHDLGPSPTQLIAHRQEQRIVLAALRRIPLAHQTILELHYWEKMPAHECAVVLEMPVGTAKSRIRRARQLLEEAIREAVTEPAVVTSTISDLDAWARGLRELRDE